MTPSSWNHRKGAGHLQILGHSLWQRNHCRRTYRQKPCAYTSIGIGIFLTQKFCHFASKIIDKWPKEHTGDSFPEIEEMLVEYKKGKDFSTDAMLKLKAIMERKVDIITTLNDMIESQILDLLKLGYTFYDEEGNNEFLIKSTVFISDEKAMLSEEKLLDKIFTLLECYRGKRSFFVQIIYREGRGNVSILV